MTLLSSTLTEDNVHDFRRCEQPTTLRIPFSRIRVPRRPGHRTRPDRTTVEPCMARFRPCKPSVVSVATPGRIATSKHHPPLSFGWRRRGRATHVSLAVVGLGALLTPPATTPPLLFADDVLGVSRMYGSRNHCDPFCSPCSFVAPVPAAGRTTGYLSPGSEKCAMGVRAPAGIALASPVVCAPPTSAIAGKSHPPPLSLPLISPQSATALSQPLKRPWSDPQPNCYNADGLPLSAKVWL